MGLEDKITKVKGKEVKELLNRMKLTTAANNYFK